MNEDETIMRMYEATVIAEGLRMLIDKLQRSENYVRDAGYKSLLAFCANLHWRYDKIRMSHTLTQDIFGRLHIKDDTEQSTNLNLN